MNNICIRNLKSIDHHGIHINLAPITLLYGKGNAGKSTILQALSLVKRLMVNKSIEPEEFKRLVHKGDTSRRIVISMTNAFAICITEKFVEVSIDNKELVDKFVHVGHPKRKNIREGIQVVQKNDFIGIENPELSLHPSLQPTMAELFCREIRRKEGKMFILETHSELMILRLLRKLRNNYEGDWENPKWRITKDDLSVNYLSNEGGATRIWYLPVTENGDFATYWPHGFFNERANELF